MTDLPIFFLSATEGLPVLGKKFDFTIESEDEELSKIYLQKCEQSDEVIIGLYPQPYARISDLSPEKQFKKIGPVCYICKISELEELDRNKFVVFSEPTQKVIIEEMDFENKTAEMILVDESPEYIFTNDEAKTVYDFIIYVMDELEVTSIPFVKQTVKSPTLSYMEQIDIIAHHLIDDPAIKFIYNQTPADEDRAKEFVYYLLNTYEPVDVIPLSKVTSFENPFSSKTREDTSSSSPKDVNSKFPEYVQEKLIKELQRYKRLPSSSLEAQTALDYIEIVNSFPWVAQTKNIANLDLKTFISKLNETHYGMDDIKSKIEEHIALEIHLGKPIGTIMCFCGPPGTGKTSIAKAIAKASGREIIKIALGGVTDEAEFRGHRRTYVASKPGRIIEGLIKSKTQDPIILFDEVDKLSSSSSKGDPTSALLEILDPEQNEEFIDRYMELPVDLSKVTFIATANYLEKIPKPLLDRLDIIPFRFYTEEERKEILQTYMIPSIVKKYNLKDFELTYTDSIIAKLTSSQSIRVMEKNLKSIFRMIVKDHLVTGLKKFLIDESFAKFNLDTTKNIGFS